jgi:Kef-type K+ transport system membrane component KefB
MFNVLLFLGGGILVGLLFRNVESATRIVNKTTTVAIYLLLFLLGLKSGADKLIMNNLHTLGLTAFLISFFAIAGSVCTAWLTYVLFFRTK